MKKILALFVFVVMTTIMTPTAHGAEQKAYFAGGCFWCLEAAFESLTGVRESVSGYMNIDNSREKTEVVEVHYDTGAITYEKLCEVFWQNIDPDDSGGQFYDRGQKYRTAIFYQNEEEKLKAESSKRTAESELGRALAPLVAPAGKFIMAEASHQNFYKTNADHYNRYKYGSGRPEKLKKVWGEGKNE